jgi:purine-binding chemotaxis protein CheW
MTSACQIATKQHLHLICRVRSKTCALPLECLIEVMRPLSVEPLGEMPPFVRGMAIVRGVPLLVVDAAALLDKADESRPTRWIALKTGARSMVLAVDAIAGIRSIGAISLAELPPLLEESGRDIVSSIGAIDREFLVVLRAARLVPDAIWRTLESMEGSQ